MTEHEFIEVIEKAMEMQIYKTPITLSMNTSVSDLGLDSIGVTELIMEIEDTLGHELPSPVLESLSNATTLHELYNSIVSVAS